MPERRTTSDLDARDPDDGTPKRDPRRDATSPETDNHVVGPGQSAGSNPEARRQAFENEQEARRVKFEQDSTALDRRLVREEELKRANAEKAEAIATAQRENDEMAFQDGVLTHDDLANRAALLAPHAGCMLPHEAFIEGEDAVKMAFPKTTVLTLSASDIVHLTKDKYPDTEGGPGPIMHGTRVVFYKGYQDVPAYLADHQYLYDNGAYRVEGEDRKPEPVEARVERMRKTREAEASA